MRVLLVEDDATLADYLRKALNHAGYVCEWANNGVDGEFLAMEEDFDGIILDLGLPQRPGLEVLKNLRHQGRDMPILILTARDAWQERVDGLKAGADDYLGKPFQLEELLARLETILRRRFGKSGQKLSFRGAILDSDQQSVLLSNGRTQQLTAIEFRLFRYMMLHPNKVLSKTLLSEHIYEEEQLRDSNVIEVYINRLRQIFGKSAIRTFRGQGYQLIDDPTLKS